MPEKKCPQFNMTFLEWFKCENVDQITPQMIDRFYHDQVKQSFKKIITPLELSQYLELCLWPKYSDQGIENVGHLLSIIAMVNQKFRERVQPWEAFKLKPDNFPVFFKNVCKLMLCKQKVLSMKERKSVIMFLNHCFSSVELDLVRSTIQKYASFPIWTCLSESRREREFQKAPKLRKFWNALKKADAKLDDETRQSVEFERSVLNSLIHQFFRFLVTIPPVNEVPELEKVQLNVVAYCERFIEFVTDLEALLPTRRFFNTLLDGTHLVVICKRSNLAQRPEGRLFNQLLEILTFYCKFEIDDLTGKEMSVQEMTKIHYDEVGKLQRTAFERNPKLRNFSLANVASIDDRAALTKHFSKLTESELKDLLDQLSLLNVSGSSEQSFGRDFFLELIPYVYARMTSQLEAFNEMPLYPTEEIIWDENLVPNQYFDQDACLALPKLNLQFLTLHDYLLRNIKLFRLESTYEIRQDIESSVSRMKPWKAENGDLMFGGWARMALPIDNILIIEVAKPNVGEKAPSRVRAEIRVNLNVRREIKKEWESLRKHDVCILVTVAPNCPPGTAYKFKEPFVPQVGLKFVRGCEIEGMLDPQGRLIDELTEEKPRFDTDWRTFRVWLDSNQYHHDTKNLKDDHITIYDTFNIIIRRKPKENNFKAVLETIRDIMNTKYVVPEWLHDIILGYGDSAAAHYKNMPKIREILNFNDTFLDYNHLVKSFPDYDISSESDQSKLIPPFKLKINDETKKIEAIPCVLPNRGPYPYAQPKKNAIRFTPTQVEAIRSGMEAGLTIVVGPPGTGKTDVTVQIISNLYHNYPQQRTLIVTHSNQALNQLFEKIMCLDIDERHLLRLGHGEEELATEKDFSRYGRVNFVLKKRLELLDEVSHLAESLGIASDVGYTCETANYFFTYHVLSRWEQFTSKLSESERSPTDVNDHFPFHKFFSDAPQPIFHQKSFQDDLEAAKGCYRHIKKIFTQLEEFRAFEMLRTGLDRSKYLLIREAKIIAMTCTHAALKRRELVELNFQYDNIVMEEAAQILEIETFIPLLLQNPEHGYNRLKRWIMIGDHNQLPPVIKNMAYQKFSNMEQSLFTRLIRLGVPTVDLDAQGRSRPSLCSLFRWRYKNLGDLPHTEEMSRQHLVNPGFMYDYQIIDVQNFNGTGESEPLPYFYQNLAEAEYVAATFMFMRLMGYPGEKITILTTYNGQKHLLKDLISQRCASNPLIGEPHKITTVDKYQGLQNDFILLSLVRTNSVGHLRDVRRLVVAMSRAKLGLYIFGRVSLFKNCFELQKTFKLLLQRPTNLHIFPEEEYDPLFISDRKNPLIMEDMPTMVHFAYDLFQKKLEEWKHKKPEIIEKLLPPKESEEQPTLDENIQEAANEDEDEDGDQLFQKIAPDDTAMGEREEAIDIDMDY
ncbi:RNA helicase aquarius [Brevipalpus obovatus]|uniref:RNA helicase aquarius n=1 Tax=Brevipalpus obovatus TaxID=246614 RepID=UPI003D9DBC9C